jgi:hypothetical protein
MTTLTKAIVASLCVCFFIGLAYVIYFETHLWTSLPLSPDEMVGRVHKIVIMHGSIRYGTEAEVESLQVARKVFFISGAIGLALVITKLFSKSFLEK